MHWFRRLIAGTFALAITVAIVGGSPVLLLRVAGNPLPKQLPTLDEVTTALTSPDNGTLFLRLLALVGWLAWATFTISVLFEIPAQLRGRRAKRIPGMKVQQKVAAALVGSMIAVFAGASVAHAMIAAPVQAKPPAVATIVTTQQASQQAVAQQVVAQQATQQQMVYVVVRGDYLGRIAERFTGNFDSYREIAELNPKLIRNPNHIEAGWKIVLPERSIDRGIMSHATGKLYTPGSSRRPQPASASAGPEASSATLQSTADEGTRHQATRHPGTDSPSAATGGEDGGRRRTARTACGRGRDRGGECARGSCDRAAAPSPPAGRCGSAAAHRSRPSCRPRTVRHGRWPNIARPTGSTRACAASRSACAAGYPSRCRTSPRCGRTAEISPWS